MGYGSDTVLEVVEPLIMPLWNLRPAFSLWCGSWEQMQLRGEIQTTDQLYKMETPSKLSLGEGLALFAAGTYPAREYLPEGGRWMMATPKDGMDEAGEFPTKTLGPPSKNSWLRGVVGRFMFALHGFE
eukprot:symbB.v1.2.011675.t1/scaffold785.1/size162803/12